MKKPNPVGFIGFLRLNPGFVKRPNLTHSEIVIGINYENEHCWVDSLHIK